MKHHGIYVPGIHDNQYGLQSLVLHSWRLYGVAVACHVMPWYGEEALEFKSDRLLHIINRMADKYGKISLIGTSAGASAVLNAYDKRRDAISGIVSICGKINNPDNVSKMTYAENPAFRESLEQLPITLSHLIPEDRAKILSYYSSGDKTVPPVDAYIEGAVQREIHINGHGQSIAYALTRDARLICRFLKTGKI